MTKILDLIDDFKLIQQMQGRKEKYMELTTYRLNRWLNFILAMRLLRSQINKISV